MDERATIEDLERRLAEAEATIRTDAVMKTDQRESEERQASFLALSDALRPSADQEVGDRRTPADYHLWGNPGHHRSS